MSGADTPATNTSAHTGDTPQLLLEHHLKELRLPTILREYDKVARQCAVEQVDYQHYLLRITELELLDRERRATERLTHDQRIGADHSILTVLNNRRVSLPIVGPCKLINSDRLSLGITGEHNLSSDSLI